VTDLLLENNIPQLLVDYDVIMAKGFDGQHFISGLASHFRDLMVGKDERTIVLLEVGEQTKVKYLEQARKVDFDFLRKSIEIANQADFNYRSSRNQRLLIELTLMQLASITTDGEKKNDVKYIIPATQFEQATPSVIPSSNNDVIEENKKAVTPSLQIESDPILKEESASYNTSDAAVKKSNTETEKEEEKVELIKSTPTAIVSDSLEEKRKALFEKTKGKVSGLSIQGIEAKKTHIAQQQGKKVNHDQLPEDPFTQEELNVVWTKYVEHLQERGQQILASIINADQPVLKDTTINLRFPNQSMKEDLEKSQGQILEYLKRELNNYLIDFEIAVDKSVTKKYVYTDQDKFSKLVEKNPAVDLLRRTFDLDF
jgi:DNA polymerase-3 subunit gamma/tau